MAINFLECTVSSDCPNGGTNYQCNSNLCECPPQFVVDGDKCGGILPFYTWYFSWQKFSNYYRLNMTVLLFSFQTYFYFCFSMYNIYWLSRCRPRIQMFKWSLCRYVATSWGKILRLDIQLFISCEYLKHQLYFQYTFYFRSNCINSIRCNLTHKKTG